MNCSSDKVLLLLREFFVYMPNLDIDLVLPHLGQPLGAWRLAWIKCYGEVKPGQQNGIVEWPAGTRG